MTGEVWISLKKMIIDSLLLSMNAESVSVPVFAQCAYISSSFALGSWKNEAIEWNVSQSLQKVNKLTSVTDRRTNFCH